MKKSSFRILSLAGVSTGYILAHVLSANAAFYTPVSCDSQSFFKANTCDLCYEERTPVVPTQKLEGLFDTWLGNDMNPPIVYEDEQTLRPTMIDIAGSGTEWGYSSQNPMDIWELTPTIAWSTTGSTNRKVVTIDKGKQLKFMQQKSGTYIVLNKTDREAGQYIGMMKFPLIYRYIDPVTNKESDPIPHFECVTYKAGALATQSGITIVPPKVEAKVEAKKEIIAAPVAKVEAPKQTETPTPKQITQTKTGPEMWVIGILSLMLAPAILIMSKRKNI